MAFNTWDKLTKAQRDYPKTKFAVQVVDKALKKTPKNPFLNAWRADLGLQQRNDGVAVKDRLIEASQQPGITDHRLLAYIYKLYAEALRISGVSPVAISVDAKILDAWRNTAKSLTRKSERLELWGALFNAAMREELWEDARTAVLMSNKEGHPSRKIGHYTLILTTQRAAEQKYRFEPTASKAMIQIQCSIARKMMKQAYEASSDDPIAVKDIRDLRFMAQIYARQSQFKELFALWDNPPSRLEALLRTHKDDVVQMKTLMLRNAFAWELLEDHCIATINNIVSLNTAEKSKSVWELCAWRWDLWKGLILAIQNTCPKEEGIPKMVRIMDCCFGPDFKSKDRALHLTYLRLSQFVGTRMLPHCERYWENHCGVPSCFADLRVFIEHMPATDQAAFIMFVTSTTERNTCKLSSKQWELAQENYSKFEYFTLMTNGVPAEYFILDAVIKNNLLLLVEYPTRTEAGFAAIYEYLRLHYEIVCCEDRKGPFEFTPNSRILLQATMLARHLVSLDKNKENRTLALLAARLHLNLGLGKCAFQLYKDVKCKEMLLDTLSPYVLSRIAVTHPFEVKGYRGFSADEELAKVIGTIERMEKKIDDVLLTDLSSFVYDQAISNHVLKQKLHSSLTKHLCLSERRRMGRLKGESIEHLPWFDFKSYEDIADNVDRDIFPSYEDSDSKGPFAFVVPNGIPNKAWMIERFATAEMTCRVLYKEGPFFDNDPWKIKRLREDKFGESNNTFAEEQLIALWVDIDRMVLRTLLRPSTFSEYKDAMQGLFDDVRAIRKAMEKLCMPDSTGLAPEDEPTMFHENMLISCYTKLEVLRTINKLVETMHEKIYTAKSSHPLKSKISVDSVNDLAKETQACYDAIRGVAQSYINLIRRRGLAAIKAQVKWGDTGKHLMMLLDDGDVNFYAEEYVESALEAWGGVLKVKLK